jgi:hypothetical protein
MYRPENVLQSNSKCGRFDLGRHGTGRLCNVKILQSSIIETVESNLNSTIWANSRPYRHTLVEGELITNKSQVENLVRISAEIENKYILIRRLCHLNIF